MLKINPKLHNEKIRPSSFFNLIHYLKTNFVFPNKHGTFAFGQNNVLKIVRSELH